MIGFVPRRFLQAVSVADIPLMAAYLRLIVIVLAVNFLGGWLRDVLNPKLR